MPRLTEKSTVIQTTVPANVGNPEEIKRVQSALKEGRTFFVVTNHPGNQREIYGHKYKWAAEVHRFFKSIFSEVGARVAVWDGRVYLAAIDPSNAISSLKDRALNPDREFAREQDSVVSEEARVVPGDSAQQILKVSERLTTLNSTLFHAAGANVNEADKLLQRPITQDEGIKSRLLRLQEAFENENFKKLIADLRKQILALEIQINKIPDYGRPAEVKELDEKLKLIEQTGRDIAKRNQDTDELLRQLKMANPRPKANRYEGTSSGEMTELLPPVNYGGEMKVCRSVIEYLSKNKNIDPKNKMELEGFVLTRFTTLKNRTTGDVEEKIRSYKEQIEKIDSQLVGKTDKEKEALEDKKRILTVNTQILQKYLNLKIPATAAELEKNKYPLANILRVDADKYDSALGVLLNLFEDKKIAPETAKAPSATKQV